MLVHESNNLFQLAMESQLRGYKSAENESSIDTFVLNDLRRMYSGMCVDGAYILAVKGIIQRSLVEVGNFNKNGVETY